MATFVLNLVGDHFSEGHTPSGWQLYHVYGASSCAQAVALARAYSNLYWGKLVRGQIDVDELGEGTHEVRVNYGVNEMGDAGDITWAFEINTQTQHITHSLQTMKDYPNGTDHVHKGAINVKSDGNGKTVEGADIFVPTFTWEETHFWDEAIVTSYAWITMMENLVARVNHAPWRIWPRGELLILGITGNKRAKEQVPVTYRFASSKTIINRKVGDITGVDKEGWQLGWVEYEQKENNNALTARAVAVHIEQVYEYGDFSLLGINSPWS